MPTYNTVWTLNEGYVPPAKEFVQLPADANKFVDVYSPDGRLVRKQATTFSGLKGVYIVEGKKVILIKL